MVKLTALTMAAVAGSAAAFAPTSTQVRQHISQILHSCVVGIRLEDARILSQVDCDDEME